MIRFEWHERKNLSNQRKHGISFEQASAVFQDTYAIARPDHMADGEQRWQISGMRAEALLLVVHTIDPENEMDEVVRIISARCATPRERQIYEAENRKLYI